VKEKYRFKLSKEIGTLEGLEALAEILKLVLRLLALILKLCIEITLGSQQGSLTSKQK
jgi:hypothetical protein